MYHSKHATFTRKSCPIILLAALLVIALLLALFLWRRPAPQAAAPEPAAAAECPFCTLYERDGLALIDVRTGDTVLIQIWQQADNDPTTPGNWETQLRNGDSSTFSFISVGKNGFRQTHMGGALVTFAPEETDAPSCLCPEHAGLAVAPYVLADSKVTDAFAVCPVQPGSAFSLRHYSVSIDQADGSYRISIESSLFAREVARWRAGQESGQAADGPRQCSGGSRQRLPYFPQSALRFAEVS